MRRSARLRSATTSCALACSTTRVETPDDYRDLLAQLRERNLFMICANPDVVVERGDRLIYCAGALADAYAALGGEVYYAGKPYRPLYDLALGETAKARAARSLKSDVPFSRVLAIGDSVRTDLKGAHDLGVDCLFVTAGIHAEELGHRDDPDLAALGAMFAKAGHAPKAVTRSWCGRAVMPISLPRDPTRGERTVFGQDQRKGLREHLVDLGLVDAVAGELRPLSRNFSLRSARARSCDERNPSISFACITSAKRATRCSMCSRSRPPWRCAGR